MATPYVSDMLQGTQYAGGVSPIGAVEPFNDYQRQGITQMAGGAPAMGFMNGMQQAFQQQLAGAPTGGQIQGYLNTGNNLMQSGTRGMTDQDFNAGVNRYMNPYQQQVVQNTIGELNRQGGIQASNIAGRVQPGQRSFGTTAQGVEQSQLSRNLLDLIAQNTGKLNYQGYTDAANQSVNQFNAERGRDLQGSQIGFGAGFQGLQSLTDLINNANTGNMANQRNFAQNTSNTIGAGNLIQNQNQRLLDVVSPQIANRTNFNQQNLTTLKDMLGAFQNSSTGASAGQPTTLSQLGGLGMTAGSMGLGSLFSGGIPQFGSALSPGGSTIPIPVFRG